MTDPADDPDQDVHDGHDHGPRPFVTDLEEAALTNATYRRVLWTGEHLQLTVMSLGAGEDLGPHAHDDLDRLLRVEEGVGRVEMGAERDVLALRREVRRGDIVLVPAGAWHHLTNTGPGPLSISSVHGPGGHRHGTVHETRAVADEAEGHHHGHD